MTWNAFGGSRRPSGHDGASADNAVPGQGAPGVPGGAQGDHPVPHHGDAYGHGHPAAYGPAPTPDGIHPPTAGPTTPPYAGSHEPYGPQPGAPDNLPGPARPYVDPRAASGASAQNLPGMPGMPGTPGMPGGFPATPGVSAPNVPGAPGAPDMPGAVGTPGPYGSPAAAHAPRDHNGGGENGRGRYPAGGHTGGHDRPRIGHHPGHPAPLGRGSETPARADSRDAARAGRHPGTPADGTYVPEGGSSPTGVGGLREWPALVVLALLAASMVVAAAAGFRPATMMIGGTFAVAAILRMFVREVGILAVRSRFTDVMVMLVFGASVVFLGLMVPPPLIDVPWVPNRTG